MCHLAIKCLGFKSYLVPTIWPRLISQSLRYTCCLTCLAEHLASLGELTRASSWSTICNQRHPSSSTSCDSGCKSPFIIRRNLVTQQTQTMTDVISKCPDMEKAFLKAISWNNLSNICCWQPSIDFCQNVSKLQLFLESEQKKFYSPADFHARLLSSLIPLQNGIKSAPARKWSDVHL